MELHLELVELMYGYCVFSLIIRSILPRLGLIEFLSCEYKVFLLLILPILPGVGRVIVMDAKYSH